MKKRIIRCNYVILGGLLLTVLSLNTNGKTEAKEKVNNVEIVQNIVNDSSLTAGISKTMSDLLGNVDYEVVGVSNKEYLRVASANPFVEDEAKTKKIEERQDTNTNNELTDKIVNEVVVQESFTISDISKTMYTTSHLNIRKTPSIDGEKIGTYGIYKEINVTGKTNNGWYRVTYNNETAYVYGEYLSDEKPTLNMFKVSSTAYYNPSGNKTADGSNTIANFTLAGKREWLGKGCYLYRCNSDGSVGECLGYYEFHDTGWGIDGDILRGETVDIYMNTYNECVNWGRRNIYVQFIE